ncbi:MAG TPA: DUF3224 domain-containing protein [Gemmatimonadaceae bacterium]|nr:DUF3224 domain-containing protein [Gemmatimonadaceae bacterium]
MTRVTGTFKTLGWEETPYDKAAGQPTLVHADATNELTGDIEGEASVAYLMGYGSHCATFVGLARVTGKVGDREGSFVMQDIGTFENGVASGRWTILPGLGSGALRDLRGDGHFAAGPEEVSYTMDLSF